MNEHAYNTIRYEQFQAFKVLKHQDLDLVIIERDNRIRYHLPSQ